MSTLKYHDEKPVGSAHGCDDQLVSVGECRNGLVRRMHIALQPVTVAPRLRAFLPRRRLALYVRKPRARETTAGSSELLHRLEVVDHQVAPVVDVTRSSLWDTDDAKNLSGAECRFVDVPDGTVMLRAVCRVCTTAVLANVDMSSVVFRIRSHLGTGSSPAQLEAASRTQLFILLPCLSKPAQVRIHRLRQVLPSVLASSI